MGLHEGVCQKGLKPGPTAGFSIMTVLWITEHSLSCVWQNEICCWAGTSPVFFDLAVFDFWFFS